jgi:predicted SprT family Zn-dependent metalloprotease
MQIRMSRRQKKALAAVNYDLFAPELAVASAGWPPPSEQRPLPAVKQLNIMFERFNWLYFDGRLPKVRVEYSTRMSSAGSYTPHKKVIRIGRKYHELFPQDLEDTLKHEMIHLRHLHHDAAFKAEAARIGASLRARAHPSLQKPPRYVYECPVCGREYPRQKRLRMASCGVCTPGRRFDPRYKLRLKKR